MWKAAIEVKGRRSDMIAVVQCAGAQHLEAGRQAGRASCAALRTTSSKDAEAIRYHYDVSNDVLRAVARSRTWCIPAPTSNTATKTWPQAPAQEDRPHPDARSQLRPGQTLLDIGCGWGALVIRAAQQYRRPLRGRDAVGKPVRAGARARGGGRPASTWSRSACRTTATWRGQFDRITSVGMFEHVGLQHLPDYFAIINKLLAPDGMAMNHGITTTDPDNGETPYGGGEFIDKYVFPHGELAHIGNVLKTMQQGGLEVLRRGKPAPPLCAHLRPLDRQFRSPCRADPSAGGRTALPHLARLPGRLRLCLRARLDQPVPDRLRQGGPALVRPALVAQLHVSQECASAGARADEPERQRQARALYFRRSAYMARNFSTLGATTKAQ